MLEFDFSTYMSDFINQKEYQKLMQKKDNILEKFLSSEMTGWYKNNIKEDIVNDILQTSKKIQKDSECLVVIGIGGSYMGSYAIQQLFSAQKQEKNIEVIYVGNNLSEIAIKEVLAYLKDKDFSINVISKSGNTLEVKLAYEVLKKYLYEKYSEEQARDRIYITTNSKNGYLHEEAETNGYKTFNMPDDIGGRYSLITPAHLLPLAVASIDIESLINGYYDGKKYLEEAYQYAAIRYMMFEQQKYVENFSVYEPKLYYYTEFLKQLFGESEGKDEKGILPISTVGTRDLHSLGQFIQQGNKIIFETVLKVNSNSSLNTFNYYNKIVENSVIQAHYEGKVPNNIITLKELTPYSVGQLSMFMMIAASFSAYLFNLNPFDQPGVEKYKEIVNELIRKKDKENE